MGKYRSVIFLLWSFLFLVQNISVFSLTPDSDEIILTLWTEIEKTIPTADDTGRPLSIEEISKTVLEDARWILSGMIYGFNIRYVPPDTGRKVNESFNAELISEIPFGDPSLKVFDTRTEKGRFFIQIRYELAEFQLRRLKIWNSNIFPEAEALGKASFFTGKSARLDSIKDGIKLALRNYLRSRIKNKPREIRGKAILDTPPYIIISAGGYTSKVRIKLSVDKIIPYSLY